MTYAIEASGVGKRYELARTKRPSQTLVDAISGLARAPAEWLRQRGQVLESRDFWALRDASFTVAAGEAIGVIGGNGAGKSTLLKVFSRVTEPTEGRFKLHGRVASLLEVGTGFHPELSGRDNIFLNGAILGMRHKEIAARLDQIVEFAGISQFLDEPIKHFSSGMYTRLAFAVAAFLESEILIVDEVLAVGDSAFQEKCLGTMRDAASSGRTVLFVSHNMAAVSQLTRRTIVLQQGRMVFDGPTLSAVNTYFAQKKQQNFRGRRPVGQLNCQNHYREGDGLFISEIGLALDQAQEITPGGSVNLEFTVQAMSAFEGVRIVYTFNSLAGQAVLSGYSPAFAVTAGSRSFCLTITDLRMIPGEYEFSIYLGTGGLHQARKEYDMYVGIGRMSMSMSRADGSAFGDWDRLWAPVYHHASELRPIKG